VPREQETSSKEPCRSAWSNPWKSRVQ
jgi:hypothetical protein